MHIHMYWKKINIYIYIPYKYVKIWMWNQIEIDRVLYIKIITYSRSSHLHKDPFVCPENPGFPWSNPGDEILRPTNPTHFREGSGFSGNITLPKFNKTPEKSYRNPIEILNGWKLEEIWRNPFLFGVLGLLSGANR